MPNLFSASPVVMFAWVCAPTFWIYAECHTCYFAFSSGQLVYHVKFRNALYIETENVLVQADVYFLVAFPDTSKDDFIIWETCIGCSLDFTAAYTISTESCLAYYVQQLRISIGLYRIMHAEVLMFAGLFVYFAQGCA